MIDLTYRIDKEAIRSAVELDDLLKKYKRDRSRQKMTPLYQRMVAEVAQVADPKIAFHVYGEAVVSRLENEVPKKMQAVILAVCTLGPGVDRRYEMYSEDEMALAAILDEIALSWIVILTRQFHKSVREQSAEKGIKVGPAYRPGVGNLPLEVQIIIFEHLSTAEIGVTLSEYLLMEPVRSTSLVIPILQE